jgi:hypothetical protein
MQKFNLGQTIPRPVSNKNRKKGVPDDENIVYYMGPYADKMADFEQTTNLIVVHDRLGGLYMVDLEKGETPAARTVILNRYKDESE